jgi:predicted RNA-binding protein Jag
MEAQQHIRTLLGNFFQALAIHDAQISFSEVIPGKQMLVSVTIPTEQRYVIGKQGASLAALQALINAVVRKEDSPFRYRLDVNGYRTEKDEIFTKRVLAYVEEKLVDESLLLWPMDAYERRLVHEFFLNHGGYATESESFGSQRVVRVSRKG